MNQRILFHFDIIKEDKKYFSFSVFPGTSFDDIDAAFDEFKAAFKEMRDTSLENERKAKQAQEVPAAEADVAS